MLYDEVYSNASSSAGNDHISTIWGLTEQKSPCIPRKIQLGTVGISNDSLKVMAYTDPVYQALGSLSYSHAHAALCQLPRGKMLVATRNAPVQSHISTPAVK